MTRRRSTGDGRGSTGWRDRGVGGSLLLALVVLAPSLGACLDPLYQAGDPLTSWVPCCEDGRTWTCACAEGTSCMPSFRACAAGACTFEASCPPQAMDGGVPWGSDAGMPEDAGVPADGGAPPDAGPPPAYALCCVDGGLTTCACPEGGCPGAPFTACRQGTCVAGAGGVCR